MRRDLFAIAAFVASGFGPTISAASTALRLLFVQRNGPVLPADVTPPLKCDVLATDDVFGDHSAFSSTGQAPLRNLKTNRIYHLTER